MLIDEQSERLIIQRAIHDPAAFQPLYDAYFQRVYAYVAAKVDDPLDAEDLVSDTFLQVVKQLSRLNNKHQFSFAAWVFTIARNNVNDFYRRQGRTVNEVHIDDADDNEADSLELDQLLILKEYASEIRLLLDALPNRRREVLILRYFSGLRNNEITQVMGIEERTVSSHLSHGLRDLYDAYTAKFNEAKEIHNER